MRDKAIGKKEKKKIDDPIWAKSQRKKSFHVESDKGSYAAIELSQLQSVAVRKA